MNMEVWICMNMAARLEACSVSCKIACIFPQPAILPYSAIHRAIEGISGEEISSIAMHFPNLHSLDLSMNCISSIPPEIAFLRSLEHLEFSGNDLVQYDQWCACEQIPNLKYLGLSKNRIKRLVRSLAQPLSAKESESCFPALVDLDLSDNRIDKIENLELLQYLKLTNVKLQGNPLSKTTYMPAIGGINILFYKLDSPIVPKPTLISMKKAPVFRKIRRDLEISRIEVNQKRPQRIEFENKLAVIEEIPSLMRPYPFAENLSEKFTQIRKGFKYVPCNRVAPGGQLSITT